MKEFKDLKNSALETAVSLMAASAKTAPKSKGKDDLDICYFEDKELQKVTNYMGTEEFSKNFTGKKEFFLDSDILVLKESQGVIAIGVKAKKPLMMNCGKCGCKNCVEFLKTLKKNKNVNCIFKILDLGFAVCSACKTASELNIDNRVMYDIGEAIRRLYMQNCDIVLGIALSIKGNNIFFDRYLRFFVDKSRKEKKSIDELLKEYGIKTSNT